MEAYLMRSLKFYFVTCCVFFCCFITPTPTSAISIAITLDDHPMPDGLLFPIEQRTEKLIAACEVNQIKAAFFCIGSYCQTREGITSLVALNHHGHFLANHSMTHRHLSGLSLHDFEQEIKETEALLLPFSNMRKWFRYPYLDYGNRLELGGSQEKAHAAHKLIQKLGYREGYVTINTFDWHINTRLHEALKQKKNIDYEALQELYLSLLKEWCVYYINLYEKLFPQELLHTLLLHANDLNAIYLDSILQMLTQSGWDIISPEEALSSVSWREKIFEGSNFTITKPETLDCKVIDALIDTRHIFT